MPTTINQNGRGWTGWRGRFKRRGCWQFGGRTTPAVLRNISRSLILLSQILLEENKLMWVTIEEMGNWLVNSGVDKWLSVDLLANVLWNANIGFSILTQTFMGKIQFYQLVEFAGQPGTPKDQRKSKKWSTPQAILYFTIMRHLLPVASQQKCCSNVKECEWLPDNKAHHHKSVKVMLTDSSNSKVERCSKCAQCGHTTRDCLVLCAPKKMKHLFYWGGQITSDKKFMPCLSRHKPIMYVWSSSTFITNPNKEGIKHIWLTLNWKSHSLLGKHGVYILNKRPIYWVNLLFTHKHTVKLSCKLNLN